MIDMNAYTRMAIISMFLVAISHGNSINIHEHVSVACPFSLFLNPQAYYYPSGQSTLGLSSDTLIDCAILSLNGNLTISNSSNSIMILKPESISNLNQTLKNTQLSFNSMGLKGGTYLANLTLSSPTYANSVTANIVMISPAIISLSNLTVAPSAVGLPLQISLDLYNGGNLSSGPISLSFWNAQGKWSNFTMGTSALSPGQSSKISISRSNLTEYPGTYSIYAYATYNDGVTNNVLSPTINATYLLKSASSNVTVQQSFGSGGLPGQSPPPSSSFITSLTTLMVTEAPLSTFLTSATNAGSNMGLQNIANSTATVLLSIPKQFSKYLQLSQYAFLLEPRQTGYINIIINSSNMPSGSYYIPINVSATINGQTQSRTEYYLLGVYGRRNPAMPTVLTHVQMLESEDEASVLLEVDAPASAPISNATLTAYVPASAVQNASSIYTYGLASSVTLENGAYAIQFNVPYVQPNGSTDIYYLIRNPLLQSALSHLNTTLAERSPPSGIQVLGISTQSMYEGQQGAIKVYALYAGTSSGRVYFSLGASSTSSPLNLTISNPSRIVNVTPNQIINQSFSVKAGNGTGIAVLDLRMRYGNEVLSYPITVPVLPVSRGFAIPVPSNNDAYWIAVVIALVALSAALHARLSRPKSRTSMTSKLEAINEKVKGGHGEGEYEKG